MIKFIVEIQNKKKLLKQEYQANSAKKHRELLKKKYALLLEKKGLIIKM